MTGKDLHQFTGGEGDDWLDVLSFAPDGMTLLATRRRSGLWLWDVATGKEIAHIDGAGSVGLASHIPFAPDGRTFALLRHNTLSAGGDTVAVYEAATGKQLRRWPWCEAQTYVRTEEGLTFSPDGKLLTALGGTGTRRSACCR